MSANPKKLQRGKPAEPVQAMTVIERAAQALAITQTEDQLRELAQASTSITTITNPAGLDQVHGARMVLKNTRIEIEKKGKAAREDANAFSKAVIAKEKELIAIIQPEEARLQSIQDAYEAEQKRIKDEAVAREQARVAAIQERIALFGGAVEVVLRYNSDAKTIAGHVEDLEKIVVDETFFEFYETACDAKVKALVRLNELHAAAIAREAAAAAEKAEREAEAARLKAEREELERQKAEQAKRDREAQAQRDADAAAIRKQREEVEAREREAAAKQKADEDRIAAERKKFEEEQAAFRREQQEAADRAAAAQKAAEAPPPEPEPPAPIAPAEPAPLPLAAAAAPDVMDRPLARVIINLIAREWEITPERAQDWILKVAEEIKASHAALQVSAA